MYRQVKKNAKNGNNNNQIKRVHRLSKYILNKYLENIGELMMKCVRWKQAKQESREVCREWWKEWACLLSLVNHFS